MRSAFAAEYRTLLKLLRDARKHAGLSQQEVATRLGKPQSFISKYEKGERRIDVAEFLLIARALGADPYRIMRNVERTMPRAPRRQR